MQGVLPAMGAEFVEFDAVGVVFAPHDGVIPVEAFSANQKNPFPCHNSSNFQPKNYPRKRKACQYAIATHTQKVASNLQVFIGVEKPFRKESRFRKGKMVSKKLISSSSCSY